MQRIFLQSSRQLRAAPIRAYNVSMATASPAPFSTSARALAHSDYGSGDPNSGPNPSEHMEHPGPAPPNTKGGSSTAANGNSRGRPTLHYEEKDGQPGQDSEEVRKHNEEMEKRQAKSHDKDGVNDPKDKVEKGYWRGEGDQ